MVDSNHAHCGAVAAETSYLCNLSVLFPPQIKAVLDQYYSVTQKPQNWQIHKLAPAMYLACRFAIYCKKDVYF